MPRQSVRPPVGALKDVPPPSDWLAEANPTIAEADWPPAVIAGAYQTGVLAVRSLKRRGVDAYLFDCHAANPGFRSAYGPAHLCPDPDTDPDAWVRFMIDLARTLGTKPALLASSDQFVSAIATHARILAEHYILCRGIALQGLLADKKTQYDLAAKHGMPMPRTQFVTSQDEVEEFARGATFPCLVKPTHFREWRRFPANHPLWYQKVALAKMPGDLAEIYRLACSITPGVILQEIIEGPDSAKRVYLACYDVRYQRVGNAMFRELRCDPLEFGPASITEPAPDAEVDAVCDSFLRRIGYVGICEIEVKRDTRDGKVKLIEANPRLSGGGDAAPYAGVDLCWLHYLDLIGHRVVPVAARLNDFRHIVLRSDARAIPAYLSAGLITWRDVLRTYRPPLAFFDLDVNDWRYSAQTVYLATRTFVGGFLRTLLKRKRS